MPNWALLAVRILRRLPHTAKFDSHLTDCAALELIYRPYGDVSEPLRLAHVLKLIPLPSFLPSDSEPMNVGIGTIASDGTLGRPLTPVVFDATQLFKRGLKSPL